MSSPNLPQSLPAARERAVKILGDAFAADAFEMDELESRLSRVYQATTIAQLDELLKDVAPTQPDRSPVPHVRAAELPAPSRLGAFMSSTRRGGRWTVPPRVEVRALMSDFTIDLREAELPPGGCEIAVRAAMASVTILVRPGTAVDIDVQAVLASVEDAAHLTTGVDRRLPAVRITGRAVLASIEVHAPAVVAALPDADSG